MRRFSNGEELFWGGALAFTEEHKKLLLKDYAQFGPQRERNNFVVARSSMNLVHA